MTETTHPPAALPPPPPEKPDLYIPCPGPTWWLFKDGAIKNLIETAKDSLDHMFEKLKAWPARIREADIIFEAKYEFKAFQKEFRSPDGLVADFRKEALGWIEFLSGIPYGAIEMLVIAVEAGTEPKDFPAYPGNKATTAPVPNEFFEETYREDRMVFNLLYLPEEGVEVMAEPVKDGAQPEFLWCLRINLDEKRKYPYPGEFVALGVRLFPGRAWGQQQSSPYLFSGNWMDTLYYTSGIVKERVPKPDGDEYIVKWRGQEITVKTTDYTKYKKNDRVTIIKDIKVKRPSQRWNDEDTETFDEEEWLIAPITFYGVGLEG
ncbi:MAG: hypothetical protein AB1491_00045 [Thermodesulfobacteriota bacterium]